MRTSIACALFMLSAAVPAAAQHDMASMSNDKPLQWHWGVHAVGMISRVSPAVLDSTIVEAYITQPTLMGGVSTRGGRFSGLATISLEGLTLDEGELGPGTYGEGYVDRRHPHTYLHELVVTATTGLPFGLDGSLSAGRGFAPFGTDDPMMRPFVRFPVNHHLSQVLERLFVIGAVRRGPVTIEAGTFSGNEPLNPRSLGDPDRFADSWAGRITIRPTSSWELQASRAFVNSPEEPTGNGHDQRKLSVSARHSGPFAGADVYSLAEWSRTTIVGPRGDIYSTSSALAEAAVTVSKWTGAVRLEHTDRPEEGREGFFRAPWPPIDDFLLGFTRWTVLSGRVQRDITWKSVRVSPFVETSLANVKDRFDDSLFNAHAFYGRDNLWSLSVGMRMNLGMQHDRMGRYGVALAPSKMSEEMSH